MGTEKRARQKANRQARLAEAEAEAVKETREASTKKYGKIAAIVAGVIALFVLFTMLTGGDDDVVGTLEPSTGSDTTPTAPEVVLAESVPDDFEPFAGNRALTAVEPAARNGAYDSAPPMTIDVTKTYIAVIDTDAGEVSVELYPETAPLAVNNFVNLARDGYYDGTLFHRVLPGFMAQGGDPTGTGTGGPGYQFADEFDDTIVFDRSGLLAMANAGPATNGSQFFLTFGPRANLNGAHTIFGEVVRNPEVLDEFTLVDPATPGSAEGPLTVIESVRIIES